MSTETEGAAVTPPLQTVGDALERARSYINKFATDVVTESYPEEVQEAAAPVVAREKAPATEEPAETVEEPNSEETVTDEPAELPGEANGESTDEPASESGEGGDEAGGEGDESATFQVPPEIQESINKRIGKEVAKTKAEKEARETAETKIKELESSLESLRSSGPAEKHVVSAVQPLAEITSVGELSKKRAEAQAARDEAADLLDIVEDEPEEVESKLKAANIIVRDEAGQEDYSVKRMRRTLRQIASNARTTLERHIPQREEFIKTESQFKAQVEEQLPELKNHGSELSKIFRSIQEQIPEIKLNPKWPLFVAGQTLFVQSMNKAKATAPSKAATAKASPPKIPSKPKSAPVAAKAKDAEVLDLRERAINGDSESRVKYLEKILQD